MYGNAKSLGIGIVDRKMRVGAPAEGLKKLERRNARRQVFLRSFQFVPRLARRRWILARSDKGETLPQLGVRVLGQASRRCCQDVFATDAPFEIRGQLRQIE